MKEFVQYHKAENGFPVEEPGPFWIHTSKPADGVVGSRIWLLARAPNSGAYYLVYWFFADQVIPTSEADRGRVAGTSGEWLRPAVRIDQMEWFPALRDHLGNFAFGLQRVADLDLAAALRNAGRVADIDAAAIEGEPRLFFHLRRERDVALAEERRRLSRDADGHLRCEACDLTADVAYPGLTGDVCEVHHRRP